MALDGPVVSWFQMVVKVPTLLWHFWSCWFLVPDGREGSYLAVALVGPVGYWF